MMNANQSLLQRFSKGYRFAALTLVNTLVAIVLLNVVVSLGFRISDHWSRNPVSSKYGQAEVSSVYPGMTAGEVDELLEETWSRPYVYEPFTQFRERPYSGRYVNVDASGFRSGSNQGPWPPQAGVLNIFLFGGSTTFGYGVQDDQTVASHLQEFLSTRLGREVRVYNFGRGHYYLTQERILYEHLLASGLVPDLAVFVDGYNEFHHPLDEPLFTDRLRALMAAGRRGGALVSMVSRTSLGRAARALLGGKPGEGDGSRDYGDPATIRRIVERYLANKKLIEGASSAFGVRAIFVWQPVATYGYDLQYHPFAEGGYGEGIRSKYGYEYMFELVSREPPGGDFLWCADIQRDLKEPLYVDKWHYSASFSRRFASVIADQLVERCNLQPPPERSAEATP